MHNLGLFCLFSISLYEITIQHLEKLEAVTLLIKKLESGKYEKRVYALKIIINFMEISGLDEDLLQVKDHELFDFMLYFTQSELGEEQRLATRGLSKLPLHILKARNPRIMPPPKESMPFTNIEAFSQNLGEAQDRKTIKEEGLEASMSLKSSKSFTESDFDKNDESIKSKPQSKLTDSVNTTPVPETEEEKKDGELKKIKEIKVEKSFSNSSSSSETSSDKSSSERSGSSIRNKGNIHSFISSLSLKIRQRNHADADIQYFSLYSFFNLLLQININSGNKVSAEEEKRMEEVAMADKVITNVI